MNQLSGWVPEVYIQLLNKLEKWVMETIWKINIFKMPRLAQTQPCPNFQLFSSRETMLKTMFEPSYTITREKGVGNMLLRMLLNNACPFLQSHQNNEQIIPKIGHSCLYEALEDIMSFSVNTEKYKHQADLIWNHWILKFLWQVYTVNRWVS